jgi:hypothetical protein
MRLSELVSRMSPTTFTQIALVMFLAVFALMAFRALRRSARVQHALWAQIPLDDGDGGAPQASLAAPETGAARRAS